MTRPVVLMGDLVASRRRSSPTVEAAMAVLAATAERLGDHLGADLRFTRFRGDGWQVLLPDETRSLRAALTLTAGLTAAGTGLATRIAAGAGTVESPGTADLSDAAGSAFVAAGEVLDGMAGPLRFDIAPGTGTVLHRAVWRLLGRQAGRWTAGQAEAMVLHMERPDLPQDDLAATLGLTRQAVQSRLAGADYRQVLGAIEAFEATLSP